MALNFALGIRLVQNLKTHRRVCKPTLVAAQIGVEHQRRSLAWTEWVVSRNSIVDKHMANFALVGRPYLIRRALEQSGRA